MNLDFSKQKHIVKLSPRVYGDLEYKERRNWNSKNRIQRERANLMFERLFQCFYDLANSENFEYLEKRDDGKYQFTVTDGFAVVIIQLFKFVDGFIVVIQEILWPYKKDPNSWWYIVEDKPQNLIRLTESQLDKLIESYVKIFLQESNSKSKGKKVKSKSEIILQLMECGGMVCLMASNHLEVCKMLECMIMIYLRENNLKHMVYSGK